MAPTLSRPGVINNVSGTYAQDNALFLKTFSGEVLTAYQRLCIFKDMCQTKTISSGKSSQFPVTGRFGAGFHVPGTEIVGQGNMAQEEVVINIDDYLTSSCSIYSLDELKNHWDQRRIYSKELGEALGREQDKRVARVITLAARTSVSDLSTSVPAGVDQQKRTGTRIDLNKDTPTSADYIAAVAAAATVLDEKDVSPDGRYLAVPSNIYYTLVQDDRAVNQDWNGDGTNGSYAKGRIANLFGFTIVKSNHIAQGNVTAAAGERGYVFGGNTISLSSVDMTRTRMLAFTTNAVGCLKLKDLTMQMTGNDYETMYQATLMVAKYAMGFGVLRPECAVEVWNSKPAPPA